MPSYDDLLRWLDGKRIVDVGVDQGPGAVFADENDDDERRIRRMTLYFEDVVP